jgi:periplasmic mercuric ion binding protein
MKPIKTLLTIFFAGAAFTVSAQTSAVKKDTLKVSGNCGMCKSTIEKAAKSAGSSFALWNDETKELVVKYAVGKTDSKKIQQAVSKSGYDTELFTATDEAYNKLHGCCKYERTKSDSTLKKITQ